MEIRQLQYFLTVAEQLNFSKAAAILYVTQPLLSQQIADLERQLGTPLFVRDRRSVSLTPAGTALYQEASAIFRHMNQAVNAVRKASDSVGTGGTLSVGFEYTYPRSELTTAVASFKRDHPKADISVARHSASELLYMLNRDQLDLAFFTMPTCGFDSDCAFRVISTGWLSVAAADGLAGQNTPAYMKSLLDTYPVYLLEKDARQLSAIVRIGHALDISPSLHFTNSVDSILSCVECGMGTTVMSHSLLRSYGAGGLARMELKDIPGARTCCAAVWKKGSGNALIHLLLSYLPDITGECGGSCGKACVLGR